MSRQESLCNHAITCDQLPAYEPGTLRNVTTGTSAENRTRSSKDQIRRTAAGQEANISTE